VARETVSYTLGELRRTGLVVSRGGCILLPDPARLRERVDPARARGASHSGH
jgi:hypothetical protein